jgi:hypothetical protein
MQQPLEQPRPSTSTSLKRRLRLCEMERTGYG